MARQLTPEELEELIRAQRMGGIPNVQPDSSMRFEGRPILGERQPAKMPGGGLLDMLKNAGGAVKRGLGGILGSASTRSGVEMEPQYQVPEPRPMLVDKVLDTVLPQAEASDEIIPMEIDGIEYYPVWSPDPPKELDDIEIYKKNNPTAVKMTKDRIADPWEGQSKKQDGRMVRFNTPTDGYRAAARTLHTYRNVHNKTNLTDIIHRWAPEPENKPDNYVATIRKLTDFEKDEEIDSADKVFDLLKAMTIEENMGWFPYDEADIREGIRRSGNW